MARDQLLIKKAVKVYCQNAIHSPQPVVHFTKPHPPLAPKCYISLIGAKMFCIAVGAVLHLSLIFKGRYVKADWGTQSGLQTMLAHRQAKHDVKGNYVIHNPSAAHLMKTDNSLRHCVVLKLKVLTTIVIMTIYKVLSILHK